MTENTEDYEVVDSAIDEGWDYDENSTEESNQEDVDEVVEDDEVIEDDEVVDGEVYDDDEETEEEDEDTLEDDDSDDSEADEEEDDEGDDPLAIREKELKEAREELEREELAEKAAAEAARKKPFDSSALSRVFKSIDISGIRLPHPVTEGETATFKEVEDEYPGMAQYTQTLIGAVIGDYEDKLSNLKVRMEYNELMNGVRAVHPDVSSVLEDSKFDAWLDKQSKEVVSLVDYGKSKDVILVLNKYKKETQKKVSKPSKKVSSALKAPTKTKRKSNGRKSLRKMSALDEGWAYEGK